jgi:parvulin-like peptidyl-prolyl isomerase
MSSLLQEPGELVKAGALRAARTSRFKSVVLFARVAGVILVFAFAPACEQTRVTASALAAASASAAAATADAAREDHPGDWRFIPSDDLARSPLWVSHILVAHRESSDEVPFVMRNWKYVHSANRTREQALETARGLAQQLAHSSERFTDVAKANSDDRTNRQAGGFLGGVAAIEFTHWPDVLDALLRTDVGKPSGVVETRFGFHILMRHPPPPEEMLSARRIVIGHEGAGFLRAVARGHYTTRSLEQALDIAGTVVRRARESGAQFERLIDEFSEHLDAKHGGDFGVWSSLEPSPRARQLAVLSKLKIGEISEPIQTFEGVEVLQRTAATERPRYAMDSIFRTFDPEAAAEDPSSRANVFAQLTKLGRELQANPDRFAELQREYGFGPNIEQWSLGRGVLGVSEELDKLAIGQITPEPIEFQWRVALVKRLDPNTIEPPPGPLTRLELPTAPDLYVSAERINPLLVKDWVDQVLRVGGMRAQEQLLAQDRKTYQAIHDELSAKLAEAQSPEARREPLERALAKLRRTLGLVGYRQYWSAIHTALANYRPRKGSE